MVTPFIWLLHCHQKEKHTTYVKECKVEHDLRYLITHDTEMKNLFLYTYILSTLKET